MTAYQLQILLFAIADVITPWMAIVASAALALGLVYWLGRIAR